MQNFKGEPAGKEYIVIMTANAACAYDGWQEDPDFDVLNETLAQNGAELVHIEDIPAKRISHIISDEEAAAEPLNRTFNLAAAGGGALDDKKAEAVLARLRQQDQKLIIAAAYAKPGVLPP